MNREASLLTHPHAPRRRRHAFARRHDERVSPLVREVVVLLEHGKLDGAKVLRDLGEREPADLEEAEAGDRLGREQAVVLVRVAHVPVGRDERRHGVEHLRRLARAGHHRLVRKFADVHPGRSEALSAFFVLPASARRRGGPSRFRLGRERRVREGGKRMVRW